MIPTIKIELSKAVVFIGGATRVTAATGIVLHGGVLAFVLRDRAPAFAAGTWRGAWAALVVPARRVSKGCCKGRLGYLPWQLVRGALCILAGPCGSSFPCRRG